MSDAKVITSCGILDYLGKIMPFWSSKKEEAPDKSPAIVEKVEKDGDIRRKYEFKEVLGT